MSRTQTQGTILAEQHQEATALLLSADRVAELLDISTRTLWRLRATGQLPAPVRIGGSVRWRMDVVQAWITAGCPASESTSTRRRKR